MSDPAPTSDIAALGASAAAELARKWAAAFRREPPASGPFLADDLDAIACALAAQQAEIERLRTRLECDGTNMAGERVSVEPYDGIAVRDVLIADLRADLSALSEENKWLRTVALNAMQIRDRAEAQVRELRPPRASCSAMPKFATGSATSSRPGNAPAPPSNRRSPPMTDLRAECLAMAETVKDCGPGIIIRDGEATPIGEAAAALLRRVADALPQEPQGDVVEAAIKALWPFTYGGGEADAARAVLSAAEPFIQARIAEERERAARCADQWTKAGDVLLRAGEMTAQELRTAQAVARSIGSAIRDGRTPPAIRQPDRAGQKEVG